MKICIIGAGASGLMAAITALRLGAKVTLMEENKKAGKKILSTGNGKCNYTNVNLKPKHFHLEKALNTFEVIEKFNSNEIIDFFRQLGIEPFIREGYVYPNSEQASSILEALLNECERLGVKLFTGVEISKIVKEKNTFKISYLVEEKTEIAFFDKVIISSGSKAGVSKPNENIIKILKGFNLKYNEFLPALCGVCCEEKAFFKNCFGVRTRATLSLQLSKNEIKKEYGELQLTDYGLSGIPTFQLSRYISRFLKNKQDVNIEVNFLPHIEDVKLFLKARYENRFFKDLLAFGNGLLNKKLWYAILLKLKLKPELDIRNMRVCEVESIIEKLAKAITKMNFKITATMGFDKAQVCTGGIDLSEINFKDMQLKKVSGMYLAGEIIDVDGICGGYNLSWAWASGHLAGECAAKER